MTYLDYNGLKRFQNTNAQCGEYAARTCVLPGTGVVCSQTQNSVTIPNPRIGPADTVAPSVAITSPANDIVVDRAIINYTWDDNVTSGPVTFEHNTSLVKGAMAMMQFFSAWGVQETRLRNESGTVSAISGMLRAPLDFIADKLRGYVGLVDDLFQRPQQVRGRGPGDTF